MSEQLSIENLIDTLQRAKESQDLLEHIWHELGPYNNILNPETTQRLQKHFEFDDSE